MIGIITLPPTLAVYKQPDTGMVMLYMAMILPMIYFSGIQTKLLVIFTAIPVTIVSAIVILYVKFNDFFTQKILSKLSGHQVSRIYGWLQPYEYTDSSFQTRQGFMVPSVQENLLVKAIYKIMSMFQKSIQILFFLPSLKN